MVKVWKSVAFRLAVVCGTLVLAAIALFAAAFYLGTIQVLNNEVDLKLSSISQRLSDRFAPRDREALRRQIVDILSDKYDVDTEIYGLAGPDGRMVAGNLSGWTEGFPPLDRPINRNVVRNEKFSSARLWVHRLGDGCLLIVGRDMKDLNAITDLIRRAIGIGAVLATMLAVGGTVFFRRLLRRRMGAIRRTVKEIESGDLARRIALSGAEDEFDLVSLEMNRMLDRIEQLMDGVRHVSNTIAHNLRTPLGRIRARLDEVLRHHADPQELALAAEYSIEQVDALIIVFDKLLQLAELESGARRQAFTAVALGDIVTDVVELYDAAAEARGIALEARIEGRPRTLGDKDLLASALANLLDNALKYAGHSVLVRALEGPGTGGASLSVMDDGPGIPPEELPKVTRRFYRLGHNEPGAGLGLSIVDAIAKLHEATLSLEDASPGLLARIVFPGPM